VPALRERPNDLPYLTAAFVREFSARFGTPIEGITPAAERTLMARSWPGNVRELRNVLERACMLAEGPVLTERDLGGTPPSRDLTPAARPNAPESSTLAANIESVERDQILRVLQEVRGNKRVAAERLGLSRRTLYRRLARIHA
jgi:DNA-binding NtrC family response regulator